MAKSIEIRLERVLKAFPPPRCKTCWWWVVTPAIVDEDGKRSRPHVCPACGREDRARFEVLVTGISVDAL
jgi:hypothetical protein